MEVKYEILRFVEKWAGENFGPEHPELAVQWAKEYLTIQLQHAKNLYKLAASTAGSMKLVENESAIIDASAMHPGAHFALRSNIAHNLKSGTSLSTKQQSWLTEFLEGSRPEPKQRAGAPNRFIIQIFVADSVGALVSQGWTVSRSIEPTRGQVSACDVVASAMREIGETPSSYEGVLRATQVVKKKEHFEKAVADLKDFLGFDAMKNK